MEITCINCPMGCRMRVEVEDGRVVSVSGNACGRGSLYARQECVDPRRTVTAVIPLEGGASPLSVKTSAPIPKRLIAQCMSELAEVKLSAPVQMGSVVLENVCGTGIDVVATKSVGKVI